MASTRPAAAALSGDSRMGKFEVLLDADIAPNKYAGLKRVGLCSSEISNSFTWRA